MKRRNIISLCLSTLLGIVLVTTWLRTNPVTEIKAHYLALDYRWVLLASICYLSAYFLRSWRWNLLLPLPHKPSLGRTWLYAMAGNLLNYLVPIRMGDLARAWFIKRNHQVPVLAALPSVFIDKAFDTLAILFILIVLPFTALYINLPMMILIVLMSLVLLVTVGLLLMAAWQEARVIAILIWLVSWLPIRFRTPVNNGIKVFITELNIFEHHPFHLVLATLLTALAVLLDGTYFFVLFRAFNIPYPFALAMFGYTLINLSYALPQPPAQLGSNEWMMIIVFSIGFGLTKSAASAIMVFAHILTAFLMTVFGAIAFILYGRGVVSTVIKGEKIDD